MAPTFGEPVTRESICACIDVLIRKYQDLPVTHRSAMSEQDVRDYFITPLLEALGWGIVDPRERSAEKHLPRGGISDYELCLPINPEDSDPYVPVLYVEAKRFEALGPLQPDLFGYAKRSEPDQQAIDYADQFNIKRGEKIGWAILTNFEVFRVWDTRRNVLVESTDWFSDLKRDRCLEVLYLLSRDQVAKDPDLHNLAAYRVLPDIDEKFLEKLNDWRLRLATSIWLHEPNRSKLGSNLVEQQRNLRTVVQRTLDRLIVIRTAEDRGLFPSAYRLEQMVKNFGGADAVPLMLLENIQRNTFSYFDHHYNSKLFGHHLADEMEVHNSPLRSIIDEMCRANFASMNADILGATYEQYLGQTIEIGRSGTPDLVINEETRHKQGSYYTPRYIVQSIVDSTLGKYLWGTPSGPLEKLRTKANRRRISEIQDLAVADIACGSGSFLIYAFDVLLDFYQTERARIQKQINSRVNELVVSGIPRLVAEGQHDPELLGLRAELELTRFAHARIVERHLYGVDLDPQAAEIASMNLLLKALTRDERLPRILGDNIKVGNSLVSGAKINEDLRSHTAKLHRLKEIRYEIHRTTIAASENGPERPKHEKEIDNLEQEFRSIADSINAELNASLRKTEDNDWFADPAAVVPFNWQVEFPERFGSNRSPSGFTFVIGNPPYVGFHGFKEQKPFLRDSYVSASGRFDLYVPFVERGIALTQNGGVLSYICPSTFMKRGFGRELRRFILGCTTIESLHDFLHIQVFRKVLNYTCIPVLRHETAAQEHCLAYSEGKIGSPQQSYAQSKLSGSPWIFRFGRDEALVERIKHDDRFVPLTRLTTGVGEGIVTACNDVLLISETDVITKNLERKFLRKCVRGEDVKRYLITWGNFNVFYPYQLVDGRMTVVEENELKRTCPNLYGHLAAGRAVLETREYLSKTQKKWYELWCPRELSMQSLEKILVPELADRSQFAYAGEQYFFVDTTCGFSALNTVDPWYLLGILNSKAGEFLYRKTTVPKANGFLIYKTMFLNPFPVPDPSRFENSRVSRIAELARTIQAANTSRQLVENTFAETLGASLAVLDGPAQNFNNDYYNVSAFWDDRKLLVPDALTLTDSVSTIRIDVTPISRTLVLSYQRVPGTDWHKLIELRPINDDLMFFILLSTRKFLREFARRKVWKLSGRRASQRTVDVILQGLVLPIWSLPPSGMGRHEYLLNKISELMGELRRRISVPLEAILAPDISQSAEKELDDLVFGLYGFDDEERELAKLATALTSY